MFFIGIVLGIILMSCNKDKDPIVVQPQLIDNSEIYVLDSIILQNNIAYADTIKVMNGRLQTTSPTQNGKISGAIINSVYMVFGDYYSITDQELILGNPGSQADGFYSFRGDTLDYVFRTNSLVQPDFKALYLKVN